MLQKKTFSDRFEKSASKSFSYRGEKRETTSKSFQHDFSGRLEQSLKNGAFKRNLLRNALAGANTLLKLGTNLCNGNAIIARTCRRRFPPAQFRKKQMFEPPLKTRAKKYRPNVERRSSTNGDFSTISKPSLNMTGRNLSARMWNDATSLIGSNNGFVTIVKWSSILKTLVLAASFGTPLKIRADIS